MNCKRLSALLLFLLCYAHQASAYYYRTCDGNKIEWADNNQTLHVHEDIPQNTSLGNALASTVDIFNQNPSKFRLNLSWGDSSVGLENGQNEIWFSSNGKYLPENRTGVTLTKFKCTAFKSEILETDIMFKWNIDEVVWTYSDVRKAWDSYGGYGHPLRATAMHELGHVGGLLHTNDTYSIMGDANRHANANGNRARIYLGEDAAGGLVRLYGSASGDLQDVSVSHWHYVSGGPEPGEDYSEHARTLLYGSNGMRPDYKVVDQERHYYVNKGEEITVKFTYENNGKDEQDVEVAYYLSGNSTITTGDLLLGTWKKTLGRNSVYTADRKLRIPAWIPSGDYFVGVIVDPNNKIHEMTGANNATFIGIRVLPDNDQI